MSFTSASNAPDYAYTYQVGGSLNAQAPSYVERQADEELYTALSAGDFAYVFNARQMGKSSLRVRTMQRLKADGVRCIALDMTRIGSEHLTPQQWYEQIISELWRGANLIGTVNLKAWLADHQEATLAHRLSCFIEEVLLVQLADQPIVIFIDEIDSTLSLKFPINDFFALIRACYNQRVDNPIYQRLTFCLLGVATPSDLITDKVRTPFNIGRAIALQGFTVEEAQGLAQGLKDIVTDPAIALRIILKLTGGQPFLTQKLCNLLCQTQAHDPLPADMSDQDRITHIVKTHIVQNWESQDEPAHVRTIRDCLLRNEQQASQLLGCYQQILKKGQLNADGREGEIELRLSGLVVKMNGHLTVYNPIYQAIFDQAWVQTTLDSLRPYANALNAWLESDRQDSSRLLRGQALEEALTWASDRQLSSQDTEFIRISQHNENKEVKQTNEFLNKAHQKAQSRLKIAGGVLGGTLLLAGGIWVWAGKAIQQANRSIDEAKVTTTMLDLERTSDEVLELFKTQQSKALLTSMRNAYNLKTYSDKNKNDGYPTTKPIQSLQFIINNIQEKRLSYRQIKDKDTYSKLGKEKFIESDSTPYNHHLYEEFHYFPWGNNFIIQESISGPILGSIWEKNVVLQDLDGDIISNIEYKGIPTLSFSHDGRYAITGSADCTMSIFDIETNQLVLDHKKLTGKIFQIFTGSNNQNLITVEQPQWLSDINLNWDNDRKYPSLIDAGVKDEEACSRKIDDIGHQNQNSVLTHPLSLLNFPSNEFESVKINSSNLRLSLPRHLGATIPIFFDPKTNWIGLNSLKDFGLINYIALSSPANNLLNLETEEIIGFDFKVYGFNHDQTKAITIKENSVAIRNWQDIYQGSNDIFAALEDSPGSEEPEVRKLKHDGNHILVMRNDYSVSLWDWQGNLLKRVNENGIPTHAIAVSQDGSLIATGHKKRGGIEVKIWDLRNNNIVATYENSQAVSNNSSRPIVPELQFGPDGRSLFVLGKNIYQWYFSKLEFPEISYQHESIAMMEIGPDAEYISITTPDNSGIFTESSPPYDLSPLDFSQKIYNPNSSHVYSPEISEVWELKNSNFIISDHIDDILNIDLIGHSYFIPKNNFLLATGRHKEGKNASDLAWVKMDVETKEVELFDGFIQEGWINNMIKMGISPASGLENSRYDTFIVNSDIGNIISSNNQRIVTVSPHNSFSDSSALSYKIQIWNLEENQIKATLNTSTFIDRLKLNPSKEILMTASQEEKGIRLWNFQGNEISHIGKDLDIHDFYFSRNGENIVLIPTGGAIQIRSLQGRILNDIPSILDEEFEDELFLSWPPFEDKPVHGHQKTLFHSESDTFVAIGEHVVLAWDMDGEILGQFDHVSEVKGIKISPDGQHFVTWDGQDIVRLWHRSGLIAEYDGYMAAVDHDWSHMAVANRDTSTVTARPTDTLDNLLERGCEWMEIYFKSAEATESDRQMCGME